MTFGGWLMMFISWGIIIGMLIFSFTRVLGQKKKSTD
jgi:hypothetical protein